MSVSVGVCRDGSVTAWYAAFAPRLSDLAEADCLRCSAGGAASSVRYLATWPTLRRQYVRTVRRSSFLQCARSVCHRDVCRWLADLITWWR